MPNKFNKVFNKAFNNKLNLKINNNYWLKQMNKMPRVKNLYSNFQRI